MDRSNSNQAGSTHLVPLGIGITAGILTGAVGAWYFINQSTIEQKWLKTSSLWTRLLAKKLGVVKAGFLAGKMREKYNLLYLQRPYFYQRSLRKHLEENILPGIALYQVLQDDFGDQAAALTYLDELFAAKMATSNERKQLMWLKYVPDPFAMLSKASKIQMAMDYPKEGWTMKTVVDNPDVLAFDTTHCIYVDILQAYGLPELAPSFCKNDDYLMRDIPYVRFERSMTLGRGDPVCNFRYVRVRPNEI